MKSFREILSDIKKGNFASVYILYGEEPFFLDKICEALERSVVAEEDKAFDQTILYGAESNVGLLVEAANRFPVVSDRQLVILKEAQAMQKAKTELSNLSGYVKNPNSSTVLVVVYKGEKLDSKNELIKAAGSNKAVEIFDSPKIKEWNLPGYIKDYCNEVGTAIEEKALNLLIEYVGNNLSNLFSEIDKLLVATNGKSKRITSQDIEEFIGVSKDFNNFELLSAIARKDYFTSMRIVKYFAENPKSNPTVVTTGTLFSFFQKLVIAIYTADKSESSLMKALQVKSSYQLKDINTAMRNYSATQAIGAIGKIREFDTKSKGIESFQNEYSLLKEMVFSIITG